MKMILRHPLFIIGLAVRLLLILWGAAGPVTQWYVPFLESSVINFSLNPWGAWLDLGADPAAFPYGYVMWMVFLPLTTLLYSLDMSPYYSYGLTLLLADFCLLLVLRKLHLGRERLLLAVYWLSPIVILATYVLGYNDIVPVALLAFSYLLLAKRYFKSAGAAAVLAISAKLSMLVALPFMIIYFLHNKPVRSFAGEFFLGFALAAAVFLIPFAVLDAPLIMLLSNPEMGKIFQFKLDVGEVQIYIVPLVCLLILYFAWRVKRLNNELFGVLSGLAFLAVVLMTPASPGWYIWAVPLLVTYQMMSDRMAISIVAVFSVLYLLSNLNLLAAEMGLGGELFVGHLFSTENYNYLRSLIQTLMVGVGIILSFRLWRESVTRNDFFRLSRKPFVLGIAGDSGAGKDTFADAIEGLFGGHSVTKVSGDDYHFWDRQKPMWQVMTHLNPMANDLAAFAGDVGCLADGKSIRARHYDHGTGRMTRPFVTHSNDLIIASGLHALYLPILRGCYDLSIYLDIDEGLRRYFKIARDVNKRGHTYERALASIKRREPDAIRFIHPQAAYADLVLSIKPIHSSQLQGDHIETNLRLKLMVRSANGFNELDLVRALVGVCGLHVDMAYSEDGSQIEMTIEGDATADDVALAAQLVCPRVFEFLDITPKWMDGITGLMQLITISHINQALTKRLL